MYSKRVLCSLLISLVALALPAFAQVTEFDAANIRPNANNFSSDWDNVHDLSKRSALLRTETYTVNKRVNALHQSVQSMHEKFRFLELLLVLLASALALFFTFKKWDRRKLRPSTRALSEAKKELAGRPQPPKDSMRKKAVSLIKLSPRPSQKRSLSYLVPSDRRLLNDMVPCGGNPSALPLWMKFMSWELSEFDWTADQIMSLFELSHPPPSCNSNSDVL